MPQGNILLRADYALLEQQHEELFSSIEIFCQEQGSGDQEQDSQEIFKQLHFYCSEHFTKEEASMAQFGFLQLLEHKKLHQKISASLKGLQKLAFVKKENIAEQILGFIKGVIIPHIEVEDQKYVVFLKQSAKDLIVDNNQTAFFCESYRLSPHCVYKGLSSGATSKIEPEEAKKFCLKCAVDTNYKKMITSFMRYCSSEKKPCWLKASKINLNCSTTNLKKLLKNCCLCSTASHASL